MATKNHFPTTTTTTECAWCDEPASPGEALCLYCQVEQRSEEPGDDDAKVD